MESQQRQERREPSERSGGSAVDVLLEEYRQLYGLALYRLEALDARIPVAGAVLTTAIGAIAAVPAVLQTILLVGIPVTVLGLFRSCVQHARSFEDVLRRIEVIEREVNARMREELLAFQSRHPSRNTHIGGRTGARVVRVVFAAGCLLLLACFYAGAELRVFRGWALWAYLVTLGFLGVQLVREFARYPRYVSGFEGDDAT